MGWGPFSPKDKGKLGVTQFEVALDCADSKRCHPPGLPTCPQGTAHHASKARLQNGLTQPPRKGVTSEYESVNVSVNFFPKFSRSE